MSSAAVARTRVASCGQVSSGRFSLRNVTVTAAMGWPVWSNEQAAMLAKPSVT